MIYPSITELMKHVDSKYTLVIIAARRARQIKEEFAEKKKGEEKSGNEVAVALEEIFRGETVYERRQQL